MWGLDYKTARIFAWVKNVHASGQKKVWSEGKTGDAKKTPHTPWTTRFVRKYHVGTSRLAKPILRKKRLYCSLFSSLALTWVHH